MPVIEAKLARLEVNREGMLGDAVELCQASFGEAPERPDPVDMVRAVGKLIAAAVDPEMFAEADIYPAIVPAPAVRVNDADRIGFSVDNGLKHALEASDTISV